MGRKASQLSYYVASIILVTKHPYKNQGKIAVEQNFVFPLYPTGVMSQYRCVCMHWGHITTIANCHAPNAPLFSPKEMVTFTPHCHLLCQVMQRTDSFNALAIPCHNFHLLHIKSKNTTNLSKSKEKYYHVELLTAKLCLITRKSESLSCANWVKT